MITGIETIAMLKGIEFGLKEIQKNQNTMDKKLKQIQSDTNNILKKLDEEIIREFKAANQSLTETITSESQYIRESSVSNALNIYGKLIHLNSDESTKGNSGKIDNKDLIILSYLGRFYGFALLGEKNNAARQVYECILQCLKWNDLQAGLEIFPTVFFSKDYKQLFNQNKKLLSDTNEQLQQLHRSHFQHSVGIISKSVVNKTIKASKDVGALGIMAFGAAAVSLLPIGRRAIARYTLRRIKDRNVGIDPIELDYLSYTEWLGDREYYKSGISRLKENLKSLPE